MRSPNTTAIPFEPLRFNRLFFFLFGCCVVSLIIALVAQHLMGLSPCRLCKLQRIPYVLESIVALYGIFSKHKKNAWIISISILLAGFFLASYHCGIQFRLFPDPCPSPATIQSKEAFFSLLTTSPPCSKVTWSIFGLPIAAYNAAFLLFLVFITQKMSLLPKRRSI